jgi:hypothetical protein
MAVSSSDLDVTEEVLEGFRGPLTVQLCGPWTLVATLELRARSTWSSPTPARWST